MATTERRGVIDLFPDSLSSVDDVLEVERFSSDDEVSVVRGTPQILTQVEVDESDIFSDEFDGDRSINKLVLQAANSSVVRNSPILSTTRDEIIMKDNIMRQGRLGRPAPSYLSNISAGVPAAVALVSITRVKTAAASTKSGVDHENFRTTKEERHGDRVPSRVTVVLEVGDIAVREKSCVREASSSALASVVMEAGREDCHVDRDASRVPSVLEKDGVVNQGRTAPANCKGDVDITGTTPLSRDWGASLSSSCLVWGNKRSGPSVNPPENKKQRDGRSVPVPQYCKGNVAAAATTPLSCTWESSGEIGGSAPVFPFGETWSEYNSNRIMVKPGEKTHTDITL